MSLEFLRPSGLKLKTAGPASQIKLLPDVTRIRADGKDICHLEFEIVDENGVCVPDVQHELEFEIDGPGDIIGIENGNLKSLEDPRDQVHKAYHGRGLAIIQSKRKSGKIRLNVSSDGLEGASIEIDVR
jgi:beta-galactosidase